MPSKQETSSSQRKQETACSTEKADLPVCDLWGCSKIGVIEVVIKLPFAYSKRVTPFHARFCCKTHMLRHISKIGMPRYSKKIVQRMATTMGLDFAKKE